MVVVCIVLQLLEVVVEVVEVVGVVSVHPQLKGLLYNPYCSEQLYAYLVEQAWG